MEIGSGMNLFSLQKSFNKSKGLHFQMLSRETQRQNKFLRIFLRTPIDKRLISFLNT